MKTFKVDRYGDIVIDSGELVLVEGEDEIMQSIRILLSINKGEWFLNNERGLGYSVFMEDKFYSKSKIAREVEDTIMQDSRIIHANINEVSLDKKSRELKVFGYATTSSGGKIKIEEVIQID